MLVYIASLKLMYQAKYCFWYSSYSAEEKCVSLAPDEFVVRFKRYFVCSKSIETFKKQMFTGRVTLSPGSTLPVLLTRFVMRDSLCNGPKFEIILKFSMENTLNSRKKGRQNITFYFSDGYN